MSGMPAQNTESVMAKAGVRGPVGRATEGHWSLSFTSNEASTGPAGLRRCLDQLCETSVVAGNSQRAHQQEMTSQCYFFFLPKNSKVQPQAVETQPGCGHDEHICHSFQEGRGRKRHPRDLGEGRCAGGGCEAFQNLSVTKSVRSLKDHRASLFDTDKPDGHWQIARMLPFKSWLKCASMDPLA